MPDPNPNLNLNKHDHYEKSDIKLSLILTVTGVFIFIIILSHLFVLLLDQKFSENYENAPLQNPEIFPLPRLQENPTQERILWEKQGRNPSSTKKYQGKNPGKNNEPHFEQKLGKLLPLHLTLMNEEGKTIQLQNYFQDKPVILTFTYSSCPSLCSTIINQLSLALMDLPLKNNDDYIVVNISIDPNETSVTAKKKKENYPAINFLVGNENTIQELTDAAGFYYHYDQDSSEYIHPGGIVIVTPQGKISRYLLGLNYSERDLRLAIVEASLFQIGHLTDSIILVCSSFDQLNGQYTYVIKNILNIFATLVVVILLCPIGYSLFQDSKKR